MYFAHKNVFSAHLYTKLLKFYQVLSGNFLSNCLGSIKLLSLFMGTWYDEA